MNKVSRGLYHYIKGDYRVSEFALTNICTAQCSFCSIWRQRPKVTVDTYEALRAVDKLADFGVRHITLTGGEALLHPGILEVVKRCTERGIISGIACADPRLVTTKMVDGLRRSGLDVLGISVDHYTDEIEYEARKIKNLLGHIEVAVAGLKEAGIKSLASTLICRFNYDCLSKLYDKCKELGFDMIGVNYPETSLSPTYELGGDAVDLSPTQTAQALEQVALLKKDGYSIINPTESINNIVQYYVTGRAKYPCLGGNKVMFVDWFLDLYPCMHLSTPVGKVLEMNREDLLKSSRCNACGMSWYRDFSIYLQGTKSILPALRALKEYVHL